jgi:hypothetical protein
MMETLDSTCTRGTISLILRTVYSGDGWAGMDEMEIVLGEMGAGLQVDDVVDFTTPKMVAF